MTIEYDTDIRDVEAWHRYSLKLPQVAHALRVQSLGAAWAAAAIVGVLTLTTTKEVSVAGIVGAVIFCVVWAFMAAAVRGETLRRARRAVIADPTSPALGHHILEVTPESITETSLYHTLSVRWDAVASIARTKDHFFILLRSLSSMIVPFRSFSSDAVREDFIRHVERLFSSHEVSAKNRAI